MIVSSRDHGKTWSPAIKDIKTPMFPGNKFGGPAFVNNGRDNANAGRLRVCSFNGPVG